MIPKTPSLVRLNNINFQRPSEGQLSNLFHLQGFERHQSSISSCRMDAYMHATMHEQAPGRVDTCMNPEGPFQP